MLWSPRITIETEGLPPGVRGRITSSRGGPKLALVSYLAEPTLLEADDEQLLGHSNKWESREITRLLLELGYCVDVVEWTDDDFAPQEEYALLFDIYTNLGRLAQRLPKALKLLHLTGAYAPFNNQSEQRRAREFQERNGVTYPLQRQVGDVEGYHRSLEMAHHCSLIGNEITLSTFPEAYQSKIKLVTVSASWIGWSKKPREFVPPEREYLWFFGGGAVHKGLDLALDAFLNQEKLKLNVVGNIGTEKEFLRFYQPQIKDSSSVQFHGFLDPSQKSFREVARRCFAFIAPSCSESISTAAATCLQIGLYPLVSRETGITLPEAAVIYLEELTPEAVLRAAERAYDLPESELRKAIGASQHMARTKYSREAFTLSMREYLYQAIGGV